MKKLVVILFSALFCLYIFEANSQGTVVKKVIQSARTVGAGIGKIRPKLPPVKPLGVPGGLIRPIAKVPIMPQIKISPIAPKPTYKFLVGLPLIRIDSITEANNVTYKFLSHGIETRKHYRRVCSHIDSLKARFDSVFQNTDSLTEAEFAKIQSTDSLLACYIQDRANGSPEEMLMWSKMLCEIYPHVIKKVAYSKPIDFEEVTAMRRVYFMPDPRIFKKIYSDILERMVELNDIANNSD